MPKTRQEIVNEIIKETAKSVPQITNYNAGGVFRLFIEVVAAFLEKAYQVIDAVFANSFSQTASGDYLDKHAQQLGLERAPARKVRGFVIFGRNTILGNILISSGKTLAAKPNSKGQVFRYQVEQEVVLEEGQKEILVPIVAEEEGSAYNVSADLITELVTPITGVDSVRNTPDWISSPGLDRESDTSLRSRCLACWKGLGGANSAAYTAWAKSVEGVGLVLPVSLFRGLGTVDVMITGTGNIPPGEKLVALVQETVDARKPIGTDVLVRTPEEIIVDINLTITAGQSLSQDAALETIDRYFREIGIGENYESSKLSALLFASLDGVKKITFSGELSIPIQPKQIARKGAVQLEVLYDGL